MGLQVGLDTPRHRSMEIRNVMRARYVRRIRLVWIQLAGVECRIDNYRAIPYLLLQYEWCSSCPLSREWAGLVRAEDTQWLEANA